MEINNYFVKRHFFPFTSQEVTLADSMFDDEIENLDENINENINENENKDELSDAEFDESMEKAFGGYHEKLLFPDLLI